MALQTVKNINVDLYDNKYIMINAKQYDDSSRWVAITCYNQGDIFALSANKHSVYIRYRKADGNAVLNSCRINYKGEVLVELTEQMLAAEGICYVDLIIVNKGSAIIDIDTGDIITTDNSPILSTMAFCINVYEASVDNSLFESSYEYEGLNDLLQRAEAEYSEVIRLSKSYAIGDANDIRENEDYDNSKYYCEQAHISATKAKKSEENALVSETNAKESEVNSKESEVNSKESEINSKESEENALVSEQNAKESEVNSSISETNAHDYSIASQRYAVGDTGTVEGEETDNAKYYYQQVKGIDDSLSGTLLPKGTISFEELATAEKFTGYMYVVKDGFTTDETFVDGEDVQYPAGTLVYYTVDGLWACFDGIKSDVATVDEVKSYLGI